jgi:hypothetical protein
VVAEWELIHYIKPSTSSVRIISLICSVRVVRRTLGEQKRYLRRRKKMKAFVICVALLAVNAAYAARLDNQYIPPPPNAASAGGFNLDTPRQAQPSNVQNTFRPAPGQGGVQTHTQQQQVSRPGLNQGTFTSQSHGNGFQSVSAGSFSNTGNAYTAPGVQQQHQHAQVSSYQPQQPAYQQQQPAPQAYHQQQQQQKQSYQPQPQQPQYNNYQPQQQGGYNQASTTPIPILKCK